MQRRDLLKAIATLPAFAPLTACQLAGEPGTEVWLGPDYWANPMQDWRRRGKRFECHVSGGDRNVFSLTRELKAEPGDFAMSVRLGKLNPEKPVTEGWVGFRFGMRGHFDDYRDTALRGFGLEAGITSQGKLFLIQPGDGPTVSSLDEVTLRLEANGTRLKLSAGDASIEADAPAEWLRGGVAIVCHNGALPKGIPPMPEPVQPNTGKPDQTRGGEMAFWFEDWELSGPKVATAPERAWGPILFTQYTLSRGDLRLTAQFVPVEKDGKAELRIDGKSAATADVDAFSSTAAFHVAAFDDTRDHTFEVVWQDDRYTGTIRKDPKEKQKILAGALTCQWDLGFPHTTVSQGLKAANPDVLFFTGDQLYEANAGYGIQREPLEAARVDYLRKWYLFGWAFGELTRNTPCVCLADDHDVYHGNLWGAGGRQAKFPEIDPQAPSERIIPAERQQRGQDSGGYLMQARWVQAVYQTQSSHLPAWPKAATVWENIPVCFGHLLVGGVSFALLEDRKFKSAPVDFIPEANILNGWPQNPEWSSAQSGDVTGTSLLGEQQEQFLAEWVKDWEGADIKACVSQTIFCNLATLPKEAMSDNVTGRLVVQPLGGYAANEKRVQDHDSNGWPQTPRNRALRLLRAALAVHVAGDQHLGSTVQYGTDDWNDAPFALCTPAISNLFPRRWFPPEDGRNRKPGQARNMGEFVDGFGNKITVHAVANPYQTGLKPSVLFDRVTGYGFVEFDKGARTITLTNYPRWVVYGQPGASPFPGWPITIAQTDNGMNGSKHALRLPQPAAGVVEVRNAEGATVLCWRVAAPVEAIPVWAAGEYTVLADGKELGRFQSEPRKG
ncbi:MAG: alkaline phosphatase D family protein [Bryobacterales bacterium]|nr:alkaline phosphatase D family protein [Bryobacterales bacterium]